jgi:hypothetical protein
MKLKHLIVDGSNIATEGRSLPSLEQLDGAVRAFLDENEVENLTVIVDATFGHRIDKKERKEFDVAIANSEITTPPAGAIGRGDAFILQIADRVGATILSNDSFQEFHPLYPWLFEEGRLIGGKPVPGIGWVFTPRTPVRGPVSRKAMKEARSGRGRKETKADRPEKRSRKDSARAKDSGRGKETTRAKDPSRAKDGRGKSTANDDRRASNARTKTAKTIAGDPLNAPLGFIQFVSEHPIGSTVDAEVERFSSHGAYVRVGDASCYVPLKSMGDPPPRRARDALQIGEVRSFVVDTIDTPRRGIDLALLHEDAVAHDRARTSDERQDEGKANTEAPQAVTKSGADHPAQEAPVTPVKKAAKKTTKKAARKSPAKKAAKRPAKKAAKKSTRKAAKKAAKRPAKKAAKKTAKKAAKKTTKKAARKTTKKAAKRPAKKAAKKRATKRPAKRTAKKAAKRR